LHAPSNALLAVGVTRQNNQSVSLTTFQELSYVTFKSIHAGPHAARFPDMPNNG
jgi:hypothetical protein